MDEGQDVQPEPVKGRRRVTGVKKLMLLVVCFGAIFWAARVVREGMYPSLSWARSLHSQDPLDRQQAATRLGNVGPDQIGVAIPALVAAIEDEDERVSASSAEALGNVSIVARRAPGGLPRARDAAMALTRALRNPSEEVRSRAASALASIARAQARADLPFDPAEVAAALGGLLSDPSDRVTGEALTALIALADAVSIDPPSTLLEAVGHGPSTVSRARAATVLAHFRLHPEKAIAPLTASLKDPDPAIVEAAASALGELGPEAVRALPDLIAVLKGPFNPQPRPARGPAPPDPVTSAALAIGSISSGEVPAAEGIAALEETLRTGPTNRRGAAARALFEMGKAASSAAPTLLATLGAGAGPEGGQGYESWAARALGRIAPGTPLAGPTIEALIKALDAKPPGMRAYSAEALGEFGPTASDALPRLRALQQDPDRLVTRMAGSAIGKIEAKTARPSGPPSE